MAGREFKRAYAAIVLFGLVSLLGDIVYEGSRALVPDYLKFLGASQAAVGMIGGLGEIAGYALRLAAGVAADALGAHWALTFLGYGLIATIPLLSLAGTWELAAVLVVTERVGKAIRTPSRDAILSAASEGVGTGRAFGIHEFLDQVGAVAGPLTVTLLMLHSGGDYSLTFASLAVPFAGVLAALALTRAYVGRPLHGVERRRAKLELGAPLYAYSAAVALNAAGLLHVFLLLYRASAVLEPAGLRWAVPLVYLLIQAVDAPLALAAGLLYDRYGPKVLYFPFALSPAVTALAVWAGDLWSVAAAAALFGVVLGAQESIYRSAVADLSPIEVRGTSYGIFSTAYGLGLFASGAAFGLMLDLRAPFVAVVAYSVAVEAAALLLLRSSLP